MKITQLFNVNRISASNSALETRRNNHSLDIEYWTEKISFEIFSVLQKLQIFKSMKWNAMRIDFI